MSVSLMVTLAEMVIGTALRGFVDALGRVRNDRIVIDLVRLPLGTDEQPQGYRGEPDELKLFRKLINRN